jgi:hypothetical protein
LRGQIHLADFVDVWHGGGELISQLGKLVSLISVHPAPYQVDRARSEKDYARHFAKGWWTFNVKAFDLLQTIITSRVWSPIVFAGGHRLGANFKEARWLALDFDTPEYDLQQCLNDWCDTIHVIGTTKNHQKQKGDHPPCDRFRLVVPFARVIDCPRTYEHNFRVVGERYGADTQVKDRARLFFPCQEIVSVCKEGELQPILEAPPEPVVKAEACGNFLSGYAKWFMRTKIPVGERTTNVWRFAKDLIKYGETPERILGAVLGSATYRDEPPEPHAMGKIKQAIQSAQNSALRGP